MDKSVIEKIQKLLSLANSDNENEAKLATQRANELLIRYNLSMQQISDHQSEYETQDVLDAGLSIKPHHTEISALIQSYFFVHILYSSRFAGYSSGEFGRCRVQKNKTIQIVGTKENCKIASYVFAYLNTTYPKLWKDYYDRDASITLADRVSYYKGLTIGMAQVLKETKFKVEQETGLVLVKDPNLEEMVSKVKCRNTPQNEMNADVVKDGIEDGKNIKIRKPLDGTVSNSNRQLQSGK